MAPSLSPVMPPFPPLRLAEEFLRQSQVERDQLHHTVPDFDEQFYQHAVELVLRKLEHVATGGPQ
jgi:hypothetical protein